MASTRKLGIIAGGGNLPQRLAEACDTQERPYSVIGLQGYVDTSSTEKLIDTYLPPEKAGKIIDYFKGQKVEDIVLAGSIQRPSLLSLRPDLRGLKLLFKAAFMREGDDSTLRVIARFLEDRGFRVIGAHEVISDLLVPAGVLTIREPTETEREVITIGAQAAKNLGAEDKGQAVVVRDGLVVGEEDIKGTDALIERCAGARSILVKVKKPQQDERLDLPTVGVQTVESAAAAGFSGIAVEAGSTLLVDKEQTIDAANRTGTFLIGIDVPETAS